MICDLCGKNLYEIKAKCDVSDFEPKDIWREIKSGNWNNIICCVCFDIILGLTVDLGYLAEDELERRGLMPSQH